MSKKLSSAKALASLAMLTALSIVFGKYLALSIGDFIRFSFENLPILLAGMLFGPIAGALVGVSADLIGCLLVGYAINPILTAAAALIGITAGIVPKISAALPRSLRIALTVGSAHLLGSVILKSFGLALFYSMPFGITLFWRFINYIVVGVGEGLLLFILTKNKALLSRVSKIIGRKPVI